MVFGKQFRPAFGGSGTMSDRMTVIVMSLFLGLMLMLPLAGCGSGSGGNDNNNGNNNGNNGNNGGTPSRIIGKVIDQNNNNQAVIGAIVSYGSVRTSTDGSGNFSMDVTSGQTANLLVTGPAAADGSAAYYNSGYVGADQYSLANSGFPI